MGCGKLAIADVTGQLRKAARHLERPVRPPIKSIGIEDLVG